jgi:hypothetical protein
MIGKAQARVCQGEVCVCVLCEREEKAGKSGGWALYILVRAPKLQRSGDGTIASSGSIRGGGIHHLRIRKIRSRNRVFWASSGRGVVKELERTKTDMLQHQADHHADGTKVGMRR